MAQKTTDQIRTLLRNAKLNFESVENKALNYYLPKIFHCCPFTEEICTTKQCVDCAVFKNSAKINKPLRKCKNQITLLENVNNTCNIAIEGTADR